MAERFIGQLAAEFGLNPRTLRYYEAQGLLTAPQRTPGGYRLYDEVATRRLGFIAKAKSLGLTLAETRRILTVRDSGKCPCDSVRWMLQAHVKQIDRQIVHLKALRTELNTMLIGWRPLSGRNGKTMTTDTVCPRIEARINGKRRLIRNGGERR